MGVETGIASKTEALQAAGDRLLAAVMKGRPLKSALADLIVEVEALSNHHMLGSILLLEGRKLVEGAAPSLSPEYNAAIDGTEIGPAVGSCGTAAFYGEPVFVDDIKSDPLWVDYRDVALAAGLRACWSTPIRGADGKVLGTFANYYREPRHPRPADYEATALLAGHVARAIESARASA